MSQKLDVNRRRRKHACFRLAWNLDDCIIPARTVDSDKSSRNAMTSGAAMMEFVESDTVEKQVVRQPDKLAGPWINGILSGVAPVVL